MLVQKITKLKELRSGYVHIYAVCNVVTKRRDKMRYAGSDCGNASPIVTISGNILSVLEVWSINRCSGVRTVSVEYPLFHRFCRIYFSCLVDFV